MRKVESTMDGACLFRSLATGLFYKMYGINLGGGTWYGEEKTVGDLCNNVLTRWIRMVIAHALVSPDVTTDTIFVDKSIRMVLEELYHFIQGFEHVKTPFATAREKRYFSRYFYRYVPIRGGSHAFTIDNQLNELISMSGRSDSESHLQYCRRMAKLATWGGAGECFVFSRIFHYAVSISQGRRVIERYVPNKIHGMIHVRYCPKYEHYDAML